MSAVNIKRQKMPHLVIRYNEIEEAHVELLHGEFVWFFDLQGFGSTRSLGLGLQLKRFPTVLGG